jgi:mycobactin lysine-N-oxygenase
VFLDTDLLVVGTGAKGTAIAIKAHVLNSLGLGPITVTMVEASGPAAAWMDGDSNSSSRELLAISPSKDAGYPYESSLSFGEAGAAVDYAAQSFSWQRYLIEKGRYAQWVDAGAPPVQRRVYGAYLDWVLSRATDGVDVVLGRVTRMSLAAELDRWVVDVEAASGTLQYRCKAVALTGPGVYRSLPHDLDAAPRVLDCDRGRTQLTRVPVQESSDIAIVGGGESALSSIEYVRGVRPDATLTVYTTNLPMSRLESFLENRVFSSPDAVDWRSLSVQTRLDFINRTDRGVFGPERLAPFAYDERCHFVVGRITHVTAAPDGRGVCVGIASTSGESEARHDYVINCTGCDPLEQLRQLLERDAQAEIEQRVGRIWDRSPEMEIPTGRFLELEGMRPRLHLPGLAAVSQGPGFATLSCLGLLADRVLEPFVDASPGPSQDVRRVTITGA